MPDDSVMRLLYLALLLAALGGWAAVEMRKDWGKTLKMVLAWGMIFLGMMAVFGLWGDIQRGMKPRQQVSAASVTLISASAATSGDRSPAGGCGRSKSPLRSPQSSALRISAMAARPLSESPLSVTQISGRLRSP